MALRRYTPYTQRLESEDSDAEDDIFVEGKPPVNDGVRKRVGDVRFWLEDRENRCVKEERPRVNASITKCDDNKNAENAPPVKTTTTLNSKRKNTTTPRRILSHVEIVAPARKLHESPNQFVTQQSTTEPLPDPPSPAMPPKKKKVVVDAAYTARPSKKSANPSIPALVSAPSTTPALTTARRSRRTTVPVRYFAPLVDPGEELSDEQSEDDYSGSDAEKSVSTTMSSGRSTTSSVEYASDDTGSEDGRAPKRQKVNNGCARKPAQSAPDTVAPVESSDGANASPEESREKPKKTRKNMMNLNKGMKRDVNTKLPPLSNTCAIFDDMIGKALEALPVPQEPKEPKQPAKPRKSKKPAAPPKKPKHPKKPKPEKANKNAPKYTLEDVSKHIGSRPLRVATMCSGTESPLLAWNMIQDSMQRADSSQLKYQHVFSAEIVPFKQAYIERNFHPPIIFRDITEITDSTDGQATTAYGAKVSIPQDVDLVIAGTACVDFSNLNNNQKSLSEQGESGDTFAAVLHYAITYRPTILVLENVLGAPWDDMLAAYEQNGYVSAGVLVDTKNYYLPQTRQRGYMVCIDKQKLNDNNIDHAVVREDFYDRMANFRRPVSSPISSFILPNDDPLVIRATQSMARQSLLDNSLREVDWAKCEIRHINYRREKQLGIARPLTNWQESGTLVLPEYCNRLWFNKQVERVWDFVDMSLLRKANLVTFKPDKSGFLPPNIAYDSQYKTRIWDVSQNIDRFIDTAPFGIAPCLTPSGNFYITDRGGPLTFTESLSLQGLPLEKISFTTETERNIQDLAGNAMSTTVVGSAIMSALISGFKTLTPASGSHTKNRNATFQSKISGREELGPFQSTSQATSSNIDLQELLADACKSATMCVCEGQISVSEKPIQVCSECGHTSCIACGVKPSHEYEEPSQPERDWPESFIQKWRPQVPMAVQFGLADELMPLIKQSLDISNPGKDADAKKEMGLRTMYFSAVKKGLEHPLTFKMFRRTSFWIIIYESPFARLELVLDPKSCEWKLYAKPADNLSREHELRKFFEEPVATAKVTEDTFFGVVWHWRVFHGAEMSFSELNIQGDGVKVPSWAARLGLPEHAGDRVWSKLIVSTSEDILQEVQGTYELLRNCGTASESLYKRMEPTGESNMFLFLDPTRIGKSYEDCFVFARDPSRLQYDQAREITARIDAAWRPEDQTTVTTPLEVSLNGKKVIDGSCLLDEVNVNSRICLNQGSLSSSGCDAAKAMVSLKFNVPSSASHQHYEGQHQIRLDDKAFFASFGWAMEPLRQDLSLQDVQSLLGNVDCKQCAPPLPQVRWRIAAKGKEFRPYEDPKTAVDYEIAVKSRPKPFVIEYNLEGNSATLDIGINVTTLCQRAAGKLNTLTGSVESVSWTLDTTWADEASEKFPAFTLRNNSDNVAYSSKILEKITLYNIQQQSLSWMKQQEEGNGQSLVIEEAEEAILPHLGWRLESRAASKVHVKGGILADHAGFGKTVTSLALIQSEFDEKGAKGITQGMRDLCTDEGRVQHQPLRIAATLIICPSDLVHQWVGEIKRLLPNINDKNLIVISKLDDLKKRKVDDFKQAMIIIVNKKVPSLQATTKVKYLERLAMFAAMPEYTGNSTRAFQSYLRDAASRVPEHLHIRSTQGDKKLKRHLEELYVKTLSDQKYYEFAEQSKRLKGKAYANKNNAAEVSYSTINELKEERPVLDTTELGKCVLLEMFHFNRLVVDEFSYTEGSDLVTYCNINADKRWALSATPRLRDLYDVSRMARFLGINLPVGASAPGLLSNANVTALRKEMTNVELFESFREMPSRTAQKKMHALAQEFLDTFLRQNVLMPDKFPYEDEIVPVILNADHRLVYTDLSQKLNSQDMKIRKGKSQAGNLSFMPSGATAEEALLSAAAVFDPKKRLSKSQIEALEFSQKGVSPGLEALVKQRENDCMEAREVLEQSLQRCRKDAGNNLKIFRTWVQNIFQTNAYGDQAVADEIVSMAGWTASDFDEPSLPAVPKVKAIRKTKQTKAARKPKQTKKRKLEEVIEDDIVEAETDSDEVDGAENEDQPDGETADAEEAKEKGTKAAQLKDWISHTIQYARAYATSTRTLRFVKNALNHEKSRRGLSNLLSCEGEACEKAIDDANDLDLSATCGHVLCSGCIETTRNMLGICPVSGCEKEIKSYHLLHLGKLGESVASEYGSKADKLTELLKKIAADRQQAIIFVQFADQIADMVKILKNAGISHHNPSGNTAKSIQDFQSTTDDDAKKTVLILNSNEESAAGANLMNANHVIFFSPLLKRTQYEYDAQMAQGIGRVRRPGQLNPVRVYRFVALDTIDVDILEHREHRTNVLAEYDADSDEMTDAGTDFEATLKHKFVKPGKTQLIRDQSDGKIKLVPRQMLLDHGGEGVFEGSDRVLGYEKFNSLIKFSTGFIQDD